MTTVPRRARQPGKKDQAITRQAFIADRVGVYEAGAVADAVQALTERPLPKTASGRKAALPKGFPTNDVRRWVPIGPSVARLGQAGGRPRVNGRIRDLAVSSDGARVYAASAMGGLWYSSDAGTTWGPVGGWADRAARAGGANNAQSCGCLLVSFGATADDDLVMVGTGETVPANAASGQGSWGGLGVLAAKGPAGLPLGTNPWEDEAGTAVLEGLGVFRMARDPDVVVAAQGFVAGTDRVLAATSAGLFLGTRTNVATPVPHDVFTWVALPGIDQLVFVGAKPVNLPTSAVTDVLWVTMAGKRDGRIVVAVATMWDANGAVTGPGGLAISDDLGKTFTWVSGCNRPGGQLIEGTSSIALSPGTTTVYVLTGLPAPPPAPHKAAAADTPSLFQIADITPASGSPVAVPVTGVPTTLWGAQRDYDQALVIDRIGGTSDRAYLGGSTVSLDGDWSASLWCFDVGAGPALAPATGISRSGAPPAGESATTAGCIGNDVHADVHAIVLGGAGGQRQVWVGCDGGVFVSASGGRVHTFVSTSVGLASLQAGYVAAHPTSSHFVAAGFQDNGSQVRAGDTVWEEIFEGDGGGLAFHPWQSQRIVGQWTGSVWNAAPAAGFRQPSTRLRSGQQMADPTKDREAGVSAFYSGCAYAAAAPATARLAIGTNRIWLNDNDLGAGSPIAWRVLPYATGPATDPRPGGADKMPAAGVPTDAALGPLVNATTFTGPLGPVITVRWVSPTVVIALFRRGVMRWTENPPGTWTADSPLSRPAGNAPFGTIFTDLFPVPGTSDFYLTTTGDLSTPATDTCYLWDNGTTKLVPTGLRHSLDPDFPAGTLGPLEPAYAVVVDPAAPTDLYVGTVAGVWHGVRTAGTPPVDWKKPPFVNGLPPAAVQDLAIWQGPADGGPRLMRAALQARGVWEVDLAGDGEPARTYLRMHARDDRRRFPTPMADPRRSPTASAEPPYASPDITVRPKASPAIAPAWQFTTGNIYAGNVPTYQLWTFQTAFRWVYPSVVAHGMWSQKFGDLVSLDRSVRAMSVTPVIDRALWNAVVGHVRVATTGVVSTDPANTTDPLAVYRAPWQSRLALAGVATEVDLMETVVPRTSTKGIWSVVAEPCTVDVLLHHRDSRPVPARSSFAILLWMSAPSQATLLGADASTVAAYAATVASGLPLAPPDGWTLATASGGGALNALPVALDARLPRAVPIDVNLKDVPLNSFVLFLAIGGSSADPCTAPPVHLPANPTVVDLVQRWPYAALRLVKVTKR